MIMNKTHSKGCVRLAGCDAMVDKKKTSPLPNVSGKKIPLWDDKKEGLKEHTISAMTKEKITNKTGPHERKLFFFYPEI